MWFVFRRLQENPHFAKVAELTAGHEESVKTLAQQHAQSVKSLEENFELTMSAKKVEAIRSCRRLKLEFRMQGIEESNDITCLHAFQVWRLHVNEQKRKRLIVKKALERMNQ